MIAIPIRFLLAASLLISITPGAIASDDCPSSVVMTPGNIFGHIPGPTGQTLISCPESVAKDPKQFGCSCSEPIPGIPGKCRNYSCNIKGFAAVSPSFDCMKAKTQTEKLICVNESLANLDLKVASTYQKKLSTVAKADHKQLRSDLKDWTDAEFVALCRIDEFLSDITLERCVHDAVACIAKVSNLRMGELQEPSQEPADSNAAADLKGVYKSSKYGFEIRFPESMEVTNNFSGSYLSLKGKWRLSGSKVKGTPLISIQPGKNAKISRSSVSIRVGIHAGKTSEEACDWSSEVDYLSAVHGTETIHGKIFRRYEIEDGGMSHSLLGVSYQIFHNGNCYVIERIISGVSREEDENRPDQGQEFYKKSEEVARSFVFTR